MKLPSRLADIWGIKAQLTLFGICVSLCRLNFWLSWILFLKGLPGTDARFSNLIERLASQNKVQTEAVWSGSAVGVWGSSWRGGLVSFRTVFLAFSPSSVSAGTCFFWSISRTDPRRDPWLANGLHFCVRFRISGRRLDSGGRRGMKRLKEVDMIGETNPGITPDFNNGSGHFRRIFLGFYHINANIRGDAWRLKHREHLSAVNLKRRNGNEPKCAQKQWM